MQMTYSPAMIFFNLNLHLEAENLRDVDMNEI